MESGESRWLPSLESWLTSNKGCQHTKAKFLFHGVMQLEGDVVGWLGSSSTVRADFGCELKDYPLPIGSGGYGSVGQALMLRRFVSQAYVACAADGGPGWQKLVGQHHSDHQPTCSA